MKGLRGNFELILIGIFILIFLIWAISKCNASKEKLQEEAAIEAKEDSLANQTTSPSTTTAPAPPATQAAQPTQAPQPAAQPVAPAEPQYTKLYITIDKLKLRKQPGLKGESITELPLFEEVYFLNEMTDSTTQLNLGKEMADEPWVKIKTKKGQTGWVYGAGVHYHKKKRSGTL